RLIPSLRQFLLDHQLQGINLDFEEVAPEDGGALSGFVRALRVDFAPRGLVVTEDVPADDDTYNLRALASSCDFLVPMLYDEHASDGTAGPVASQPWFQARVDALCRALPPEKMVLALGNYGYDWERGRRGAVSQTFQDAVV